MTQAIHDPDRQGLITLDQPSRDAIASLVAHRINPEMFPIRVEDLTHLRSLLNEAERRQ
jgi:hypothetical protein